MSGRTVTFRTNRLLIIAGPPCSGKSTLLSRIHAGELPTLCEQLRFDDPQSWTHLAGTELHRRDEPLIDRLVVHYDLLAQRVSNGFRHIPQLVDGAGEVVILTLLAEAESLRRRNQARVVEAIPQLFRHPGEARQRLKRLRRLWRRHRVFRREVNVRLLYREWFEFSSRYTSAPHWTIDSNDATATAAEPLDRIRQAAGVP